tara:strand:+ start:10269 stop:10589 length:321 start_codon:yes stop_codon:yes gene_type:complete
MTNTRTISCPDDVEKVFKELMKKKPSDISFSRMLAICAQEYIKLMGNAKISEFTNENVSNNIPHFFCDIIKWKKTVEKMSPQELKKLQVRHGQIDTIIRKRVNQLL